MSARIGTAIGLINPNFDDIEAKVHIGFNEIGVDLELVGPRQFYLTREAARDLARLLNTAADEVERIRTR